MKKFLISAAAAAIMTGAAYAQTATEFYVVQDTSTKKCTIVLARGTSTAIPADARGL
jgi:NAD(P)H-dependent flavin oxidoreductase YrpB (nitropropane dioxygenase family)